MLQPSTEGDAIIVTDQPSSTASLVWGVSLAGPYLIQCRRSDCSSNHDDDDDDNDDNNNDDVTHTTRRHVSTYSWSLTTLDSIVTTIDGQTSFHSEGRQAWAALHESDSVTRTTAATITIRGHCSPSSTTTCDNPNNTIATDKRSGNQCSISIHRRVDSSSIGSMSGEGVDTQQRQQQLLFVLTRIFAQWMIHQHQSQVGAATDRLGDHPSSWTIIFQDEATTPPIVLGGVDLHSNQGATKLFSALPFDTAWQSEMVEMTDREGRLLGRVPRKLVHSFNLLHRGIGMFVTKDQPFPSLPTPQSPRTVDYSQLDRLPDLYVHRRTDSKRIFPSLYDMFVGGVSGAGETSYVTAQREIAEELGLHQSETQLQGPWFQCVVCTGYNRCVVDVFLYVVNTRKESIQWQVEEVAWGAFVPYPIVVEAAHRSIQRLVKSQTWPGRYPPTTAHSSTADGSDSSSSSSIDGSMMTAKTDVPDILYGGATPWDTWDFVPDGLLVWEAWLDYVQGRR